MENKMKKKRNKEAVVSAPTLPQYCHLLHKTSCDISWDTGKFFAVFHDFYVFIPRLLF
jgi:hypothetical protein